LTGPEATVHREKLVDDAHREAFARDGFVLVPDLLDAAELDHFGRIADAAVAARTRAYRPLAERSRYEQSFLQCINLWEDHPEMRRLTFHPRICATAAGLLGIERIRLWHDQALYKEAGGRETDAHQDQPYWPIAETDTITAWIPFDDVAAENGPMGFVSGSHRLGLRRFVNIFFGQPEPLLAHPALADREPVFVPVSRGGVLFHHGLTVHLAQANRSAHTRRVHTAIYFRDGSTRAARGTHESVDRAGIRPGQVIDSDATPIAWPRDEDDLPERPSSRVSRTSFGSHLWPG
jgi:ectoine hydroxylase-related dioxygenase (phytanoyl-CoA dioxygenase family)